MCLKIILLGKRTNLFMVLGMTLKGYIDLMEELSMMTEAQTAVMARMKTELEAAGIAQLDASRVIAYIEAHPTLKMEMQAAFPLEDIMDEPEAAIVGEMIRDKKHLSLASVSQAISEAYATGSDEVKAWTIKIMQQTNNSYEMVLEKFKGYYQQHGLRMDARGFFMGVMDVIADGIHLMAWLCRASLKCINLALDALGFSFYWLLSKVADGVNYLTKRDPDTSLSGI
jgi:hypothetical protein